MELNTKELLEKKGELSGEMRKLADIAADTEQEWSAEHEEKWEKLNAEYDDIDARLQKLQRMKVLDDHANEVTTTDGMTREEVVQHSRSQEANRRDNPGIITPEDRALALRGWFLTQRGDDIDERTQNACSKVGLNPRKEEIAIELPRRYRDVRARMEARVDYYNSTDSNYGGQTIPEGFVYEFERALLAFGGTRQVARVLRTATGNDLPWPTSDDTSNTGAQLSEVADSNDSGIAEQVVSTSSLTLKAWKFYSKLIRVTAELLEDSAFNMADEMGRICGERIARILEEKFIEGAGTTTINGLENAATSGKTAAATTSIDSDELIDLIHSVDPAYRQMGAGFMFHDNVAKALRKLKDSDGRYLWEPAVQAGQPDRLMGYPVQINQNCSSTITASDITAFFGAFQKYIIRDVAQLRLRRLVERYAEYDQEGFVAFSRHDGNLLDAGTNPVKYLQQAAS